jgi:hypothetical protein
MGACDRLDAARLVATVGGMAGEHRFLRHISAMMLGQVRAALSVRDALAPRSKTDLADGETDPPVVAQLMIEIRADGSRTIARGALHDLRNDESAQVHVQGRSPAELMLSLANALLTLPPMLFAHEGDGKRKVDRDDPKERAGDEPAPPPRGDQR